MVIYKELMVGIFWFFMAHVVTFFQLNGQFFKSTDWFRNNEFLVAFTGVIISLFYIWGTKYAVSGFGGLLWPARFIGFGVGMIIYATGVGYFFNEGLTPKTIVSLIMSLLLICVQVLWK
tara:strand:+ start:42 stop:398 length:357 start_codon:yes stop_codon:yes gene_type:complete